MRRCLDLSVELTADVLACVETAFALMVPPNVPDWIEEELTCVETDMCAACT